MDTSTEKVDVDTANAGELQKIPGIGHKTAQAIVDFRDKFGQITKEQLAAIPHIRISPELWVMTTFSNSGDQVDPDVVTDPSVVVGRTGVDQQQIEQQQINDNVAAPIEKAKLTGPLKTDTGARTKSKTEVGGVDTLFKASMPSFKTEPVVMNMPPSMTASSSMAMPSTRTTTPPVMTAPPPMGAYPSPGQPPMPGMWPWQMPMYYPPFQNNPYFPMPPGMMGPPTTQDQRENNPANVGYRGAQFRGVDGGGHRENRIDNDGQPRRNRLGQLPKSLSFDGKGSWQAFFTKFERYASINGWTEEEKKDYLCLSLNDKASEFYSLAIDKDEEVTFEDYILKLEKRFGFRELTETAMITFTSASQDKDEMLDDWADRVMTLASKAFRDLPDEFMTRQAILRFCHGARDKEAGESVVNMEGPLTK